jgi:hypothetical protein
MTRKLLKTAAIVVIALAPVVAAGSAEAHGGRFWRRLSRRGFSRGRFRAGRFSRPRLSWRQVSVWWDFWEGFYPGYYGGYYRGCYGFGSCYLIVYGTTHCLLITAGCPGSIAVPHQSPEPRPIAGADGSASPGPAHDQRLMSASVSKRTAVRQATQ